MPYRTYTLPTLTAAGTPSGSAVGTVQSYDTLAGRIVGIYFDYSGTVTTTDVAVMPAHSAGTILSVANNVTDGWYYPTVVACNGTAGALDAYAWPPIVDQLKVVLSQGSAGDRLDTTVLVEF